MTSDEGHHFPEPFGPTASRGSDGTTIVDGAGSPGNSSTPRWLRTPLPSARGDLSSSAPAHVRMGPRIGSTFLSTRRTAAPRL